MRSIHVLASSCVTVLVAGTLLAHPAAQHAAHDSQQPEPRVSGSPDLQDRRGKPMEVVDLPDPAVSIRVEGEFRIITTNSLPNHPVGEFPNPSNPNAMRALEREFRIPLHPKKAERPVPARPEFGVALNGVVFDAGTGEFWTASGERGFSAWNYDAGSPNNQGRFGVDSNHGHVQPTGKYHYHGVPTGLLEALNDEHDDDGNAHEIIQLGWAFDGFPVYAASGYQDADDPHSDIVELSSSYRLKQGNRPASPDGPGGAYDGTYAGDYEYVEGLGDLDASNGRTGVTPEFPDGTYYYVITDAFPSVPRTWVGTPDQSMMRRAPGGGGPPEGRRPRPGDDARSSQNEIPAAFEAGTRNTPQVNPAYFIKAALAAPIVTEERTLADGSTALCYVIRTYSEPHEHEMGPWAPATIEDDADEGGIWFDDGKVYDVDGPFVRDIAEFYDDPGWKLYRDDGTVRVTDTLEAFEAAARPDVDPQYQNHVVEGRPEWIDRQVSVFVIPAQPVYKDEPTSIGRPQGGDDRGAHGDGPPPRRRGDDQGRPTSPDGRSGGGAPQGGPGLNALGIAFNGVEFAPPAPVEAILGAHTIAPFDDAGGHLNPHDGYHYHAVTGHTKEIAQPDGHAPMIGYAMDGFGLYAHANADGSIPGDLDECGGHRDTVRGYHYHVGAAGSNQIIKAFRGTPGTMTTDDVTTDE